MCVYLTPKVYLVDSEESVTSACEEAYVSTSGTLSGCIVGVKKADGKKCSRCWFHDNQVGKIESRFDDICQRCDDAIGSWEKETSQTFEIISEETEETQPVA